MKNQFDLESPKEEQIDYEFSKVFERDYETAFEREILPLIKCQTPKKPKGDPLQARWNRLLDRMTILSHHWIGNLERGIEMIPHYKQSAGRIFARTYFMEFIKDSKNKKHLNKTPKAILTLIKQELASLDLWSCVHRALEMYVYDHFGAEEDSSSDETPHHDVEATRAFLKSINVPWNLNQSLGDTPTKTPPLPNLIAKGPDPRSASEGRTSTLPLVNDGKVSSPLKPQGFNIKSQLPVIQAPQLPVISIPHDTTPVGAPILQSSTVRPSGSDQPKTVTVPPTRIRLKIRRGPTAPVAEVPPVEALPLIPIPTPCVAGVETSSSAQSPSGSAAVPGHFMDFYHTQCLKNRDDCQTLNADFYRAYENWRIRAKAPPMGKNSIGAALKKLGIVIKHTNGKTYYYIKLRSYR